MGKKKMTNEINSYENCPECSYHKETHLNGILDYVTCDSFNIIKCTKCQNFFTDPVPSSLSNYYQNRYRKYNVIVLAVLRFFYSFRVKSWVKSFKGNNYSALEIGCGDGFVLSNLKNMGWKVLGVERDEKSAIHARNMFEIEMISEPISETIYENNFDLIILFQVLEHVHKPFSLLNKCKKMLKTNGKIIISIPNIESWQAKLTKQNWQHLDVPRHLNHFTKNSLNFYLDKLNLSIDSISYISFEHDIYGWIQSLLNCLGFEKNLLLKFLMKINVFSIHVLISIILSFLLILPAIMISMISWISCNGSIIEIQVKESIE
jgi:SAM-dependent methyltransferase|tara:strand:+ start:174 stop:1130 length:957 start_codon:yes stop_codon:yes gene_type:complete